MNNPLVEKVKEAYKENSNYMGVTELAEHISLIQGLDEYINDKLNKTGTQEVQISDFMNRSINDYLNQRSVATTEAEIQAINTFVNTFFIVALQDYMSKTDDIKMFAIFNNGLSLLETMIAETLGSRFKSQGVECYTVDWNGKINKN